MAGQESRVRIHSKLTVVSSKPAAPGKTHPLSASDHAMGLHTLHLIFYYKNNPLGSFDLNPLRMSLSEALSLYPTVTGRLTRGKAGNWVVECNDAGVRVLIAEVRATLDEWLRSADACEERDLTVWEDMPDDPSTWSPFRIQINEFEGGSIAIGLSCTQMQADPTSATLFFNTWTQIHRNQPISHPPFLLSNTHSPPPPQIYTNIVPSPKMSSITFRFSHSTIKNGLSEVQTYSPDAIPFDFLAALFWTRITHLKASSKQDSYRHSLSICLDSRQLLQPPLPIGYFGNAFHRSLLSLNEDEMDWSELGKTVQLVHQHVCGVKEEDVRSLTGLLEMSHRGGEYAMGQQRYGPELTCVSMEHMIVGDESLVYAACFEKGMKPKHVSYNVGNEGGEGLIMVMPSPEDGLGRTIMVMLPEEEISKLREDQAILKLEPTLLLHGKQLSFFSSLKCRIQRLTTSVHQ